MRNLVVFAATVTGAVLVGVLRSLLKPRPEEFAQFGATLGDVVVVPTYRCESADWWILDDVNDGAPVSDEARQRVFDWWKSTQGDS